MKKLYYLILLFTLCSSHLFGQISLEHTYSSPANTWTTFYLVKLTAGDKFAVYKQTSDDVNGLTDAVVQVYNTNHSLYKSITVPLLSVSGGSVITGLEIVAISDNLFKTDSKIEYLAQFSTYNSTTSKSGNFLRIYDEDGTIVFSKDSAQFGYAAKSTGDLAAVFNSTGGTKLLVMNRKYNDNSMEVYSLPGTLLSANQPLKKDAGNLSYPIPNPSSDLTRIEFELPEGVQTGELLVYSMNGTVLKKYLVDNTFGDLLLNNTDLAPGTYYYQLNAGSAVSETKKMMIIK